MMKIFEKKLYTEIKFQKISLYAESVPHFLSIEPVGCFSTGSKGLFEKSESTTS
ncbi:hypothetical protein [Novacetimonas hansenii]|uniref:hypothetical protein n=1 Tax=Novacetimonas hansenii TaxID=436 RepID=UPI000B2A4795|nr:hypothetical protein [Novacetimonas hansenii]